jgi:hypothetical protein
VQIVFYQIETPNRSLTERGFNMAVKMRKKKQELAPAIGEVDALIAASLEARVALVAADEKLVNVRAQAAAFASSEA